MRLVFFLGHTSHPRRLAIGNYINKAHSAFAKWALGHLRLEPNQYNTSRIFSVIYCILEHFRLFINGIYRYLQA